MDGHAADAMLRGMIWTRTALLCGLLLPSGGCALAVGAAIGAGVVHTTSEDSVELTLGSSEADAFEAAEAVVDELGAVRLADSKRGQIEGTVEQSEVTIATSTTESGRARVTVSARRVAGLSPDLETARKIAGSIAERLD